MGALGLEPEVAGAWIGGNIDTTAAVSAAGATVGEEALQIATIVKTTQNALLGIVAVALTAYFAFSVERGAGVARTGAREFWERFPKCAGSGRHLNQRGLGARSPVGQSRQHVVRQDVRRSDTAQGPDDALCEPAPALPLYAVRRAR